MTDKTGKLIQFPKKDQKKSGSSDVEATSRRVLFADSSLAKFHTVAGWLRREGLGVEFSSEQADFVKKVSEGRFDVCVVNLLLGRMGPFELVSQIRKSSLSPTIKVIVLSKQVQRANIENCMRAGANDFVADPFGDDNLFHRVVYHLAPKREIKKFETHPDFGPAVKYIEALIEFIDLLSRTDRAGTHESFVKIVQHVAQLMGSNRTSLYLVDSLHSGGVVLASSDDPDFFDFPISLVKYPEILHVVTSGSIVVVDDVSQNMLTNKIKEEVSTIEIGSLMAFPVYYQGDIVGVLHIRHPKAFKDTGDEVLRVLQAIANTLAAHANTESLLRRMYRQFEAQKT